ncbi:MAG: hypothetical protein ABEH35_00010 [Haloarculaceae archaeon]
MASVIERFDHPAWRTFVGVAVGYGAIILLLFILVFLGPLLVFF